MCSPDQFPALLVDQMVMGSNPTWVRNFFLFLQPISFMGQDNRLEGIIWDAYTALKQNMFEPLNI